MGSESGRFSAEEAALILHVSHPYLDKLVRAGELVANRHSRSRPDRFSKTVLLAYQKRSKTRQRAGLTEMMRATGRLGLYDAELEEVSNRRPRFEAPDEGYISTYDAAKLLFVSRRHVMRLIEEGTLPVLSTAKGLFLRQTGVLEYKSRRRAPGEGVSRDTNRR